MSRPLTIAHLTDVHLGPISGFTPRYWNAKRLAGYVNWRRNRRAAYRREVLDRVVADMQAQAPDHIAVTGDLANIGLPQEHIDALAWLASVGPPERVSVVPGNHDIYSRLGRDPGTGRWARYMTSDRAGKVHAANAADFPFVRVVGELALVGVNSAVPTPPLIAWGRVGKEQLESLAAILDRLGAAGLFRLVLIHHPPLPGQSDRYRGLRDAAELRAVLEQHGAELVIHGHHHHNTLAWCLSPGKRPLPVVGAPSGALGIPYRNEPLARYNLYRIDTGSRGVELIGRGLASPDGEIIEIERRMLEPIGTHETSSCEP
jgi:3',5'-cyclic AMP phosphodiesterase CpdA